MSGAFGWHNNSNSNDTHSRAASVASPTPGRFNDALSAYQAPIAPPAAPVVRDLRAKAATMATAPVPTARHTLKSTAANVIIVSLDKTGSMDAWTDEVFKRVALMWREATKYLGSEDLEILFIAHGDARTDNHPLQVTRFGHGPELDEYFASLKDVGGGRGGGQGSESTELVAYYVVKQVDTSSARHAYMFFVTDEAGCDFIDPALVRKTMGTDTDTELARAADVMRRLRLRMNAHVILCRTDSYDPEPIRRWWEQNLGTEQTLPLDDARRVVDVMLATIAKETGQLDAFADDMLVRQGKSCYARQNVQTVLASVAMVGGSQVAPPAFGRRATRPLLPSPGSVKK